MAYFMYLYILFADGRMEKHLVKRFSDLSHTKSKYYYYEEPHHERGKGICILRDDICCFELSPFELCYIEEMIQASQSKQK